LEEQHQYRTGTRATTPGDAVAGKAVLPIEVDLPACGIELAQQYKEIQIVSLRGRDP
jgi:hypothetical protein